MLCAICICWNLAMTKICVTVNRAVAMCNSFHCKTILKETFPRNVVVHCQEGGWMKVSLVLDWICTLWCRWSGTLRRLSSILFADSFHRQPTSIIKKLAETKMHL